MSILTSAFPAFDSLAQLQAEVAALPGRRVYPLYQPSAVGDDSAIIGHWRYNGSAVVPVGPIDLTKAAWGYATVASVAGAVATVDASPTLGTSGTLRAWDVSAGASLGDVAYTRVGTAVTLTAGALGSLAAGDVLYEVVGGRTGALDISATGEIRPLAVASVQPRAAGLYCAGDVFFDIGATWSVGAFISANLHSYVSPTVDNEGCAIGWSAGGSFRAGVGFGALSSNIRGASDSGSGLVADASVLVGTATSIGSACAAYRANLTASFYGVITGTTLSATYLNASTGKAVSALAGALPWLHSDDGMVVSSLEIV